VAGVGALAALTIATRLAVRAQYLLNWDAVQFALGVQRFDIVAHRPHPPGYLGYVLLGRLATAITGGNHETGLVMLSAAAEAAAVVLAYLAARSLWGRFAGWAAAVLLFSSPLFWFYGATALTYALEPAFAVLVLYWAFHATRGNPRALVLAAVATAAAGAIRPTDELFLAVPLGWAAWRTWRAGQHRPLLLAAAALGVATVAWVGPLLVASGGLARYLLASRELSAHASATSAVWRTGFSGLWLNGGAVAAGIAMALGLFAPVGGTYLLVRRLTPLRREVSGVQRDYAILALCLLAPALAVYLLVHIGQLGYILLLLPALLLPAGVVIDRLARILVPAERVVMARTAILLACAVVNVATFALPRDGLRDQLTDHDARLQALVSVVRAGDPRSTVLVTGAEASGSYRFAQYYLPEYAVIALGRDRAHRAGELFATDGTAPEYDLARFRQAGAPVLPPGTRTVLVLDREAAQLIGDFGRLSPVMYGDGWRMWQGSLGPGDAPVAYGRFVYLLPADCPCRGAIPGRPVPVPGRAL
jgi:hypothetical protein